MDHKNTVSRGGFGMDLETREKDQELKKEMHVSPAKHGVARFCDGSCETRTAQRGRSDRN